MKKRIVIIGLIILFFGIFKFGIKIGNISIGHVNDYFFVQDTNFVKSSFYQKYFKTKDKVIVLDVWATWCEPCIEEIPILNKIKDSLANNDNVIFLAISKDIDTIKIKHFLNKHLLNYNDITMSNAKYRDVIINKLEDNKNSIISSYSLPRLYIIKNRTIIKKYIGTIDPNEVVTLIRHISNNQ